MQGLLGERAKLLIRRTLNGDFRTVIMKVSHDDGFPKHLECTPETLSQNLGIYSLCFKSATGNADFLLQPCQATLAAAYRGPEESHKFYLYLQGAIRIINSNVRSSNENLQYVCEIKLHFCRFCWYFILD